MVSWRPGQITFLISTLASFRKFISFSNILTKLGFFKRPAGLFLYISSIGDMIRIVKFFLLTNGGAEMDGWSFERILVVLLFITAGAVVICVIRGCATFLSVFCLLTTGRRDTAPTRVVAITKRGLCKGFSGDNIFFVKITILELGGYKRFSRRGRYTLTSEVFCFSTNRSFLLPKPQWWGFLFYPKNIV